MTATIQTAVGGTAHGTPGALHANRGRVLGTIDTLASFGADPDGGVTRPAFSAADREAIGWLGDVCRAAGLAARVDQAGNLIVSRPDDDPGLPALLMGSHLDTVNRGGRLDGAYGVLAAVEVVRRLHELSLPCAYRPVAVGFANEEGALFPQPFWGSRALIGSLTPGELNPVDIHGRSLREPLALVGGDLDRVAEARWRAEDIALYLELHIEQGPVLERAGVPVGVVDSIVGRVVLEIDIQGAAGHAGTTPMSIRRDALAAAAEVVLSVRRLADRGLCTCATVGRIDVVPNSTNVIPGAVRLTAELRDVTVDVLSSAEALIRAEIEAIATWAGVACSVTATTRATPRDTDPRLRSLIADTTRELGLNHLRLPSGAGHDAQIMAERVPTGMIFVPSRDGRSHVPDEHTTDDHLVAGVDVLLNTAVAAQRHPIPAW